MKLLDNLPDVKAFVAGHLGLVGRTIWRHLLGAVLTNLVGRSSRGAA